MKPSQGALALIAVAFGLATVITGGRVLAGADPGYVVFRPLLVYNTCMGTAYLAAGVILWRSLEKGVYAAATILGVNSLMLGAIGFLHVTGGGVAIDSVGAMIFRTVAWLAIWLASAWLSRSRDDEVHT